MTRAVLLFAVGVTALSTGHAPARRQERVSPTFTAFPDIKLTYRVARSGEKEFRYVDFDDLHAKLRAVAARPLAADATQAAKVRSYQLKSGVAYLSEGHARMVRERHRDLAWELFDKAAMTDELYQSAAAGEPEAVRRELFYERVRALKAIEERVEAAVLDGSEAHAHLHFIRFHRLRAEAELLKASPQP